MRKRRRLADKLIIMVCAVLVAVSAFFYVPMEVEASFGDGSKSGSVSANVSSADGFSRITIFPYYDLVSRDLFDIDDDTLYRVTGEFTFVISSDVDFYFRNTFIQYNGSNTLRLYNGAHPAGEELNNHFSFARYFEVYAYGKDLYNRFFEIDSRIITVDNSDIFDCDYTFSYSVSGIYALTGEDSVTYNQGYNAGYSAGEQVGESNGYSNGYSEGYEVGEQSGYDSGFEVGEQSGYDTGFQEGQDSVDTQSYYDAGYQAGYQVGYQDGYDNGYDVGYQSAMDRIDSWGADTTEYPVLIADSNIGDRYLSLSVKGSTPLQYSVFDEWAFSYDYNPSHTYCFYVDLSSPEFSSWSGDVFFLEEDIFYFYVGGLKYKISDFESASFNKFFVPGDRLSSAFSLSWEPYAAIYGDTLESDVAEVDYSFHLKIYDYGPSGDTQNHIANQTDQLTGGYNDSQGNSVNNDFSSGLNEFETAEDSLFATATTGLKDFTFFDIQSVPAMVTGMSFVGSIMSGWFTQAGGASGVGIVLSILFSIMLVAMVLGLYRWYQSKGGND